MSDGPSRYGPFVILSPLGQGAMGTVFRARQEPLGREVALKVLAAHLREAPGFRERFLREARAAAAVVHPHVISCYDCGEDHGQLYMALELALGGDLDGQCSNKPLPLDQVLPWIRDCALGLQAIADAGLVHRDVKPANIFLDQQGRAKVADLGLARHVSGADQMTMAGAVLGTPAYMAPEQARGADGVDIRADIWGLGASLYKLITGRAPFVGETPMQVLHAVMYEAPPDPRLERSDIPEGLVRIYQRCLQRELAQRYQRPAELAHDIEDFLSGRTPGHAGSNIRLPSLRAPESAPPEAQAEARPPSKPPSTRTPKPGSDRTPKNNAAPVPRPGSDRIATAEQAAPKKMRYSQADLQRLAGRVHTDERMLCAWLNLAPGACFPRDLLEALLEQASVRYGLDQTAITAATRPAEHPRRLILARGEEPTPGVPGRDISGEPLPAEDVPIRIKISEDGMQAVALLKPGELVAANLAKSVILRAGVCFGIDPVAAKRLYEGPPDPGGRIVVARGKAPIPGRAAGFHLCDAISNTTADSLVARDLSQVFAGDLLAEWKDSKTPVSGMDVCGVRRDLPAPVERSPEAHVGEGVELARDRNGQLILRATRDGLCQQLPDGSVRVIKAREIHGDLAASSPPIQTDEVVVIRGSVRAGAVIESSADVVICGDVEDAQVQCSGLLQVNGAIADGTQSIIAGEGIECEAIGVRRVLSGSITVRGTVRGGELIATGDIRVEHVIGGSLLAGGCIHADKAGDEHGTTTALWAGHHLDYAEQAQIAALAEAKLSSERQRLMQERKAISGELNALASRQDRLLKAGGFLKQDAARAMREESERLARERERLEEEGERRRQHLAQSRGALKEMRSLASSDQAAIDIGQAFAGTVIRLADADPQQVKVSRRNVQSRLSH